MVMIKMLTHRGFCRAGGTTPALCSLGRYFASLFFDRSAILILWLQTAACGFARLAPGLPSAGPRGIGLSSRSITCGHTAGEGESLCFLQPGVGLPCSWAGGRGARAPPSSLGPEPIDLRLGHPALPPVKPRGRLPAWQCSRASHGETANCFANTLKMEPDHSTTGRGCSSRCKGGIYPHVAPFAHGTTPPGATRSPIPLNLTFAAPWRVTLQWQ